MVLFFLGTAQTLRICFFGNPRSNSIAKKFGAYHSSHPSSIVCDAFFFFSGIISNEISIDF